MKGLYNTKNHQYSFFMSTAILCSVLCSILFLISCSDSKPAERISPAVIDGAGTKTSADISEAAPAPLQAIQYDMVAIPTEERPINGSLTITAATKLDTDEYDEVVGLIGSTAIATKKIGSPIISVQLDSAKENFYETEISAIDCKTNEKTVITSIVPINEPIISLGLDKTHFYVVYAPFVEYETIETQDDYSRALNKATWRILQISIINNSIKTYPIEISGSISKCVPLGSDALLLNYYIDNGTIESLNYFQSEHIDIFDFNTEKLSKFQYVENISNIQPVGATKMSFASASEDKVYFKTQTNKGSSVSSGFRIYDSQMNFLDGLDVVTTEITSASPFPAATQMLVQNQNIYYKTESIDEKDSYYYYKFSPSTAGIMPADFDLEIADSDIFYTANPRNAPLYNMNFTQISNSSKSSIYCSTGIGDKSYNLNIAIDGFIPPKFLNESHPIKYDYSGDFLLLSKGDDDVTFPGNFDYYYVSESELERALFG